jgi:hypothetical protein
LNQLLQQQQQLLKILQNETNHAVGRKLIEDFSPYAEHNSQLTNEYRPRKSIENLKGVYKKSFTFGFRVKGTKQKLCCQTINFMLALFEYYTFLLE